MAAATYELATVGRPKTDLDQRLLYLTRALIGIGYERTEAWRDAVQKERGVLFVRAPLNGIATSLVRAFDFEIVD